MWKWNHTSISAHNIRLFYITKFLNALIFIIPIWVAYERQFLTLSQFAFVEAVIVGIQLFLELPTGAFADLVGKRWSVILGQFCSVASLVIFCIARSYEMFLFYAVLAGISEAFISGSEEALLYDSLKEDGKEHTFDKVNVKLEMVFQISIASAAFIGGFLGSISYTLPILCTAGAALANMIIMFWFREPHVDTEKFTLKRYVYQTKIGAMELIKNNHIAEISLFYILVGFITWGCQMIFNMSILTEVGLTAMEIGLIVSIVRIINSVVLFKFIHIDNFLTKSRTFLMFPIIMTLSLLPGLWLTKWSVIPSVSLIMFASTARWVILGKYTNQEFDSKNRATAISTLSMSIGMLYILILLISGPIMERFGGTKIIYTLLGIVTLVTVLPLGIHLAKIHYKNSSL